MKINRSFLIAAVVIVVAVSLAGAFSALPQWSAVLVTAGLLVVAAIILRPREREVASIPVVPQQPVMIEDQAPLPTPSRAVADIRLPSADEDYDFVFSAAVYWTPAGAAARHADLSSVAVNALLQRARKILATRKPGDESQTQHMLAAVLGYAEIDEGRQVRTWAEKVGLRLPDQDAEYLRRLVAMKRKRQMIELERELERDLRAYLKDEVLATPGSAAVWWFAQHPDQVEKAVELYPVLSRLSAAANDLTDPTEQRQFTVNVQDQVFFASLEGASSIPSIAAPNLEQAVEKFLEGHDEPERSFKASNLAKLEERFRRPEQAELIRARFSVESAGDAVGSYADGRSANGSTTELDADRLAEQVEEAETVSVGEEDPADASAPADTENQPEGYREPFVSD